MFKFIKRILFIWVLIVLLCSVAGGGLLRSFGDKAGGVAQKIVDVAAGKADDLKADAGLIIDWIRKLTDGEKGIAKDDLGNDGKSGQHTKS